MTPQDQIENVWGTLKRAIAERVSSQVSREVYKASTPLGDLHTRTNDIIAHIENIGPQIEGLKSRGTLTSFHGELTVHEAWSRHSGVKHVFARYHLPHCEVCPVGADETLKEAAAGHGISIKSLLIDLDRLLYEPIKDTEKTRGNS